MDLLVCVCTQVEREQRQEWSQLQGLEHDDDDRTDVASADTDAEAELVKQGMTCAASTSGDCTRCSALLRRNCRLCH
jgi:hypothetical protein